MAVFAAVLSALAAWVALRAALAARFSAPSQDVLASSRRRRRDDGALGRVRTATGNTGSNEAIDGKAGRMMSGWVSTSRAGGHRLQAGERSAARRVFARCSAVAAVLVPVSRAATDRLRLRLFQAGVPVPASAYYGASVTAVACGLVLASATSSLMPTADSAVRLVFCLAVAGVCACAPWAFLEARTRARRAEIEAALPATLEMLAVTVEAGLTLERALRAVSARRHDALAHELSLADDEISLFGYTRDQALERMARRCGSDDLALFASSVAVSSKAGAPIASILKRQAAAARTRRFQKLEAEANKIPTKMVFPLAFLVMPGVFIVAISPAVISIANNVTEVF